MLVVVNPTSGGSRAATAWPDVLDALRALRPDVEVVAPPDAVSAAEAVRSAAAYGHDAVVMAGGDGSVNLGLNALLDPSTGRAMYPAVALGAIGLGSSNDVHKPFDAHGTLAGRPARVDVAGKRAVDVGRATMLLPDGSREVRHFLLNASMGLVADGNHAFNTATGVLARLKEINSDVAIAATALRTVARSRPLRVEIRSDANPGPTDAALEITNLAICKSVHFAGDMRYDTGVTADDGAFDVNLWRPAPRLQVLGLIAGLYRGRFSSSPLADCRRASWIEVRPDRPVPLETDGEITVVESARLEVLPRAIEVCA